MFNINIEFIKNGILLKKNITILTICPKCGNKLKHVPALDTEAKMYLVWCDNLKCRFVQDYYLPEKAKEVLFNCH